jgi:predicted PolB exonuclease-like 3'-5' exonuclease
MGTSDSGRENRRGFLIFDIETRIDKDLVRRVEFGGDEISDAVAFHRLRENLRRRSEGRSEFVPHSFHVPVSIVLGRADADYRLGDVEVLKANLLGERAVVDGFWDRIERFDGTLVSFNGRGFDLPVLELQALRHRRAIPRYFNERGGLRTRFGRHYDLYDFLTNNGAARMRGGLDLLVKLIGSTGKTEVSGRDVQSLWEAGRYEDVHLYCRRDVIQTYLLLVHVEHLRGRVTAEVLQAADEAARRHLE